MNILSSNYHECISYTMLFAKFLSWRTDKGHIFKGRNAEPKRRYNVIAHKCNRHCTADLCFLMGNNIRYTERQVRKVYKGVLGIFPFHLLILQHNTNLQAKLHTYFNSIGRCCWVSPCYVRLEPPTNIMKSGNQIFTNYDREFQIGGIIVTVDTNRTFPDPLVIQ